jgi:hypothetical protein
MTFGLNFWKALFAKEIFQKTHKKKETITVEGYENAETLVFNITHVIGLQVVAMSINQ